MCWLYEIDGNQSFQLLINLLVHIELLKMMQDIFLHSCIFFLPLAVGGAKMKLIKTC